MDQHLPKIDHKNKTRYFFSLLGPRFEAVNRLMADSLTRRFGYPYEPISIFTAHPGESLKTKYYIYLNEQARQVERDCRGQVIYIPDFEDINKEFVRSPMIRRLTDALYRIQGPVPIYSFTSTFLTPVNPKWLVLGPNPKTAEFFDNKIRQYDLFRQLRLPHNHVRVFRSPQALAKTNNALPAFVSAAYTSGGSESELIYSRKLLHQFLAHIRPVNRKRPVLAATIFKNIVAFPNVNAIVMGRNKTLVLVISDQIMCGNHYLGNIYPTSITRAEVRTIRRLTVKIGNFMSRRNFRGVFGCDFLINGRGRLVVVDLNPRRQGGYLCNAFALETLGWHLTDWELACALHQKVRSNATYEKLQYPAAWAHMKIKPPYMGQTVIRSFTKGSIPNIFSKRSGSHSCLFYQPGSVFVEGYAGYIVRCAPTRRTLLRDMNREVDKILHSSVV